MEEGLVLCDTNVFINFFNGNFRLSHNLQIPDAIIAASAVTFKLPLFTYNLKDFKFIPNIRLYTPLDVV